jgi:hypothetical protein
MNEYIDITESVILSGLIGSVSPLLFPYLFKLASKIAKRELGKQEKRLLVALVSFLIALGFSAYSFDWSGNLQSRAWEFAIQLFTSWAVFQGTVKNVYELIVKNLPELDKRLEERAN